jgi:hypothetical protein
MIIIKSIISDKLERVKDIVFMVVFAVIAFAFYLFFWVPLVGKL